MNHEPVVLQGQYNIGHICTKLQCERGHGDKVAMRFCSPNSPNRDFSFSEMDNLSNKSANLLSGLGFVAGEIFFIFLPKMPEIFDVFLGALKLQLITGTLFSNFGEEAILDRLGDSQAKGIITKKSFLKKLLRIRNQLPCLEYILVVDIEENIAPDILSYPLLVREASASFETPKTSADTPSVLHYTSGSTGKPKGVLHRHKSVVMQNFTAREVLHLDRDDVYWCTADQGWVTGTSYGIIGPWSLGVTQIQLGGNYDAELWLDVLVQEAVSVWYTAPTALRMLMRESQELLSRYDLQKLKYIFSVGEPLNPEVIQWSRRLLGKEIYDTWFQTETGAITIANRPGVEIKPGSMGTPVNGAEPLIVADDGSTVPDNESGNLCLKIGWPSMFVTYLNNDDVYQQKFKDEYYYTGDTAFRDEDGYFWFAGRSDDVINSAGHLISPFEVESSLLEIIEIAESGVIGVPDQLLFEKIVAFITLHKQYNGSRDLEIKIRLHVANKVSSIATPQEIFFLDAIPKNKSGKIMRRVLKSRYLGIDAGDISTLEM